jgi:hypothetical protein
LVAALVTEHAPQGPTEEHKDSGEFWWGMPSNKDGSISENRDGRLNARGSSHVRFAPRRCIDRVRIAYIFAIGRANSMEDRRGVLIVELNQRPILTAASGRSAEGHIRPCHKSSAEPAAPSTTAATMRVPATARRPDRHGGRGTKATPRQKRRAMERPWAAAPNRPRTGQSEK